MKTVEYLGAISVGGHTASSHHSLTADFLPTDDHGGTTHRYLVRRTERFENGIHHAAGGEVIDHDGGRPIDDNAGAMRWNW